MLKHEKNISIFCYIHINNEFPSESKHILCTYDLQILNKNCNLGTPSIGLQDLVKSAIVMAILKF